MSAKIIVKKMPCHAFPCVLEVFEAMQENVNVTTALVFHLNQVAQQQAEVISAPRLFLLVTL